MKLRYLKNVVTLKLDMDKCIGCRMCTQVCPHGVFQMSDGKACIIDRDACMECGACMKNCPADAIVVRTGVGCVSGVIRGFFRGTGTDCDCCCEKDSQA